MRVCLPAFIPLSEVGILYNHFLSSYTVRVPTCISDEDPHWDCYCSERIEDSHTTTILV